MNYENSGESNFKLAVPSADACAYCKASASCHSLNAILRLTAREIKQCRDHALILWREALDQKIEDMELGKTRADEPCPCSTLTTDLDNLLKEANSLLLDLYRSKETCMNFTNDGSGMT